MSPSTHTVLVEIVEETPTGDAVSKRRLAESLAVPETALDPALEKLRECEFIEATEEGYRPTTTTREVLALDVDFDDILVLDVVDDDTTDAVDE
ncbi:hypothetical protein [Halapricum hydrolyticum]|uniref:Uncharacterized protein n=1 Tax=Halapricum hydrolyticum TaxID=2979991 RepID=A0AAE3I834_9EURY|nr:hypothetical protein [Halapricum hydrolyticum]MCU4717026.1 hypothetical protein [Halapricum hydrolyticum]MCU4725368.1 hypothetical protein [Halapricum hydrolyticum]